MEQKGERIPEHIAIIMDGNGRWATQHGLPRIEGHKEGAKTVRRVVEACARRGVKILTLFAFSRDNWGRPEEEIEALFSLLHQYLHLELPTLMKEKIRFRMIGDRSLLPEQIRQDLQEVESATQNNSRMLLNVAINYSGREEIVRAAQRLCEKVEQGKLQSSTISPEDFRKELYTNGMADPDLLIRTSNEYRLSDFLLWQVAYSELFFTPTLWPDFTEEDLNEAIDNYQKRERRFGRVQVPDEK